MVDAYLKKTKNVEIETVEQTVGLDFFFQMLMLNARNNLIYITLSQSISCMLSWAASRKRQSIKWHISLDATYEKW